MPAEIILRPGSWKSFLWGIDFPPFPFWLEKRKLKRILANRIHEKDAIAQAIGNAFPSPDKVQIFQSICRSFRIYTENDDLQLIPTDDIGALSILFGEDCLGIGHILMALEDEYKVEIDIGKCSTLSDLVSTVWNQVYSSDSSGT